ncbi:MAG TPA: CHAD domain-containing protein [Candidatus Caenarcaniphilales bacterium]
MNNTLKPETFGHYAHQAINKHFQKSVKPEAAVLKDEHPEPLHEMRVGMRRLRTALQVFSPAIVLPKAASVKRISKIARSLGQVRDLDVMHAELKTRYRYNLNKAEKVKLDALLESLQQRRRHEFVQLEKTLSSHRYLKFKKVFENWLAQPVYQEVAELPILEVLPDLLLPLVSELLLHPGWLMGTTVQEGQITLNQEISPQALSDQLEQQGEVLHRLRKQMKRVRYQTEFFIDFYSPSYAALSQEFQTIQKILGQIQDSFVLGEYLGAQLKDDLAHELPRLVAQMQQERVRVWQDWQPIQQRYLDQEFRQSLRSQVITPLAPTLNLEEA